jgi:ribosome maturation factor RimP
MHEASRRIEALAAPIAAAFGCDVVAVRFSQGRRRAIVTVFLDVAQPEPSEEEWKLAARPLDPAHPEPAPYGGSRVSVDTCGKASREIEAAIEVEGAIPGSYVLEVSSPGLDRPLVRPSDFVRHRGRRIEVRIEEPLAGSRHLRGTIVAADRAAFWLGAFEAGSGAGTEPRRIEFGNLVSARLLVEIPQPVKPGHPGSKARKR